MSSGGFPASPQAAAPARPPEPRVETRPSARSEPSPSKSAPFGAVAIRYLAGAPILVIGSATRAEYRFSRAAPLQQVARADVETLLASGYFRRES